MISAHNCIGVCEKTIKCITKGIGCKFYLPYFLFTAFLWRLKIIWKCFIDFFGRLNSQLHKILLHRYHEKKKMTQHRSPLNDGNHRWILWQTNSIIFWWWNLILHFIACKKKQACCLYELLKNISPPTKYACFNFYWNNKFENW